MQDAVENLHAKINQNLIIITNSEGILTLKDLSSMFLLNARIDVYYKIEE